MLADIFNLSIIKVNKQQQKFIDEMNKKYLDLQLESQPEEPLPKEESQSEKELKILNYKNNI